MRLDDIHRWDLIPSSGEEWQVRYHGAIDLLRHQLSFETEAGPGAPITVGLRVNDFLTNPSWSVLAQMRRAPAEKLLPLAQRMGLSLPEGLRLAGNLDGAIGYSAASGWNGGLSLSGIKATLPNSQTLSSDLLTLNITDQRVQILPSIVAADDSAPIEVSGNYDPSTRDVSLRFGLDDAAVRPLSRAITSWFGTPPMLAILEDGRVSGQLQLEQSAGTDMKWRGDFDLKQGRLRAAGVGVPIRDLRARVSVAGSQLTVPRFTAVAGNIPFNGEYRYNSSGLRRERLRLVFSTLDVMALRAALAPAFGPQDFLSRFRIVRRATPSWMANRNLEADAVVTHLLVNGNDLGALQTRCLWTGDTIRINSAQLRMNQGRLDAQGAIDLSSGRPQYELTAAATNVPWNGGAVDISGEVRTSGSGTDALVNLRSSGNFVAYGVTPSDETFSRLSGAFSLAIESGAPKVNLTNVEAERPGEAWVGIGASNPDGTLVLQLVNGERQMRIASPMVSAIVSADTVRP